MPETFGISRLEPNTPEPAWARRGTFYSVTRTSEELSVVCQSQDVPEGQQCEPGWRCIRIKGKLAFEQTGVLASLAAPLAEAGISLFVISTYDTDYLLVKEDALERTAVSLRRAGHQIQTAISDHQNPTLR